MAKKAAPAYDAGEKETADRLAKLFEAAKFEIQREMDLGDRPRWDLVLSWQELGRYRRFVVELAMARTAQDTGLSPTYRFPTGHGCTPIATRMSGPSL